MTTFAASAHRNSRSVLSLEPFADTLWIAFLIWSVLIATLWTTGLSETHLISAVGNPGLRDALTLLVKAADALWMVLAAANVYLVVALREGLAPARLWTLWIVLGSGLIAACSLRTGYPLGTVAYTTRLGMKVAGVPFGWPLLLIVVILGGREAALQFLPRASHVQIAMVTGLLAVFTDLNLESLASHARFFWFWYVPGTRLPSSPLWWNYATWALLATGLALLARSPTVAIAPHRHSTRPVWVFVILNTVFLLTHLSRAIRV